MGALLAVPGAAAVLSAYASSFDWPAHPSFDAALRAFLAAVRLPVDPAAADRVLAGWAAAYYEATQAAASCPSPSFADADAVHVLAFSAVLLNTDLHSAAVKQKMSRSDFGKNLAGANGGADFAPPLLDALYASVTVRPMLVPDAGGGGGGGDGEAGSLSRAASSAGGWGRRSSRGGGGGGGGGGASGASRRRARWWACFAKG